MPGDFFDRLVDVVTLLGALALGGVPMAAYVTGQLAFEPTVVILLAIAVMALILTHSEVARA